MMRFLYLIIFIMLFGLSCKEIPSLPCNTRDKNQESCYIAPPSGFEIASYDIDSLYIQLEINPNADDILLTRSSWNDTLTAQYAVDDYNDEEIPVGFDSLNNHIIFYDDREIGKNTNYSYEITYLNEDGSSDPFSSAEEQEHLHQFLGPETVTTSVDSDTLIKVSWKAPQQFTVDRNSITFQIKETITGGDSEGETTIEETFSIASSEEYYIYRDLEQSTGEAIEYVYEIWEERKGVSSTVTESDSYKIDIPSIAFIDWIPITSQSIFLIWDFDDSTMNEDMTYLLTVTSKIGNDENVVYAIEIEEGDDSKYFTDNISTYNPSVASGTVVEYKLEWCAIGAEEACGDEEVKTATFPVNNMVYIPSFSSLPVDEFDVGQSDHFYIDVYEVSNHLYDNPTFPDNLDEYSCLVDDCKKPATVNANSANDFCGEQGRDPEITINTNQFNVDFSLPSTLQWKLAAGVGYDEAQISYSEGALVVDGNDGFNQIPIQHGWLDCNSANIIDCGNFETIDVGSYNGIDELLATSPNGLYDCSGNVMEWVADDENGASTTLMGGYYFSSSTDAQSSSTFYCQGECSGTGFRTIIEADGFLPAWKDAVE